METRFVTSTAWEPLTAARSFEDLLGPSVLVDLRGVRCGSPARAPAIKTRAGRPKDLAAIPYIQSTIDEIEGRAAETPAR
jgi:hypothetical protein